MKRPDLNVPLPPSGKSGAFRSMIGAVRMNRLSLRFADARVEASFAEEQARKSLRPVRIAFITMAVLTALLALALHLMPHLQGGLRAQRLALVGVGFCAGFYAASYSQLFLRWQQ